ncbi:hypothetical protein V6R85_25925 [Agrobacterium sp. CCNWLW32]|jgi:hypothetical protein|uniref:hypothetical protein n=1 Tax=Agrobacterium TaxID=357 RepID=UPI000DDB6184|nr:hypothetical protein [Agrobacterium tumefaciens]NTE68892.1 hypothetical protein [Agrobacterium tumefaciens]NTE68893.1 hypothetical protein [Agrobacterium tumefaciens]
MSDYSYAYHYLSNVRLEPPPELRTFTGGGKVLTSFINSLRNRILICGAGAISAATDRHWLQSSLFARANIEACALFVAFSEDVNPRKPDINTLKRAEKYLFSTKTFGAGQGVHINDCLRVIYKKDESLQATYDVLCEAVHPNWLGVLKLDIAADENIETHVRDVIVQSVNACGQLVIEAVRWHFDVIEAES